MYHFQDVRMGAPLWTIIRINLTRECAGAVSRKAASIFLIKALLQFLDMRRRLAATHQPPDAGEIEYPNPEPVEEAIF